MATKINVDINVSDNGTAKKSTDAAERLKKTYDEAAKSASKIGASPTMAGASSRATSSAELVEYNRNRALSTGTGASARDFAKQAEGLGGLVRLYATFAANVFAVSAAFGALSSAMDTTNMIRGLDQLGAASGVALGTLSKRLVETTGGAVSLREAMEATVKASAAGIDSSSILRLGKVAQQASVALGVNASDALNRLSRGVVKLEPELLDELGIFTKIDPAVKKYAESVNKAVSELTDFERRQAFLNAVIEEGEQKFSQIEIDTNPYTKLSAALQNTLQNALELVNKGLVPIVNFLSESPGALTAALLGLGTALVRQAIPAIGQVRAGLAAAATEAAEKAQGKAGEALAARSQLKDLLVKQVELATDEQINIVDKAEEKLLQIKNGSISKQSAIYKLLRKDIADVEEADINAAKAQAARISVNNKARAAEKAALNEVISGVENWKAAHEQETKTRTKQLEDTLVYKKVIKDARDFEIKATKDAIISNVAYNASLLGTTSAMQLFKMEVAASGLQMGKFATATLTARAAMAALAGAATTLVNVLGRVLFVIGILTTAWSLLSGFFTTKELSNFSSEVDTLNTAAENLGKTFEKTAKSDAFSESSLKARASALIEFSQGLENTTASAQKALSSLESNKFAGFKNSFLEFLGLGGVQSDFAESFAGAVNLALSEIADPQLQSEARSKIGTLLNIDPKAVNFAVVLKAAIQDIKPSSEQAQSVVKIFKDIGIEAANSASRITEVKNALDDTRKSFNSLQDSYKVKNPIIEYAENGIKGLEKLQAAIKNARTPQEAGEAVRIAKELQATTPVLGTVKPEELQKRIDEITKQGITGAASAEQISAVLLQAFNTAGANTITSGIAQFNELIRKQLAVEKKKNENAFKEFAFSLTEGFDAKAAASEVSKARAELEKVQSEFSVANTGATPLSAAQTQGFQTRIAGAQAAVDIAQAKERLAISKDSLATQQKLFEKQENFIKVQESGTKLSILNGNISQEQAVAAEKRLATEKVLLDFNKQSSDLSNKQKSFNIALETLTASKAITAEEADRLRIQFEGLNLSARQALETDKNLKLKQSEVDAEQKLIDLAVKRFRTTQSLLALEAEISRIKNTSALEAEERFIELLARRSTLTRDELIEARKSIANRKIDQETEEKIQSERVSFLDKQLSLGERLSKAGVENNKEEIEAVTALILAENEKYEAKLKSIKDSSEVTRQNTLLDLTNQNLELLNQEVSTRRQIEDLITERNRSEQEYSTTTQENRLENLKQIGAIEESRYLLLKSSLELVKLESEFENRKLDAITNTVRAIQDSQSRVAGGDLTSEQVELEQQRQEQLARNLGLTLSRLEIEKNLRQGILATVSNIAVQDAKRTEEAKKLTDQYKQMSDAAKLIGDVFDGFGDRFAETVGGLSNVLQTDLEKRNALEKEYEQKRLKAAEKYKNNESKRRQELLKLQGENADKSLALDAEVVSKAAGSFKSLFKEKTAAYKAFSLVEKAAAVTTFALNAQIIASNLATLASRVSAGVAQLFAQGGFAGFAASAAFLALMGSLGIFGGKSVKNKAGPSTEDVQKAQTTGQSFQGGVLTARRGALSSDPTKTLESIDESLEILKTYGFEELDFSNKNLKALSNIERNTKGLSEALAIFALSLPGNVPIGSKTFGPFGFGSGLVGSGLSLASGALGAFGGFLGGTEVASYLGNLLLDTFGTALTGVASPLTSIITSAFGPVGAALGFLLGKNLDKVLNSVFGGKTTKTLKDVTLTIDGQLNKLSEANSELIKTFAVLEVKIDGGWFRSDRIFDELFQLETPDLVKEYVGSLFKDIKTGIEVAGSAFGMDVTKVLETSLTDPIKVSLKDLKPEEIADALKNQVSIAFNEIALAGFEPLIKALRDPLEEAGTTLTRLSSQVTLFEQAMKLTGKNIENITGTLKVVIADDLVESLGGVESFKEKISFFRENFLSEAEQIAPIATALTKELEALGVSSNLTRDQFKVLVLSQDLATDSGRSNYAALLNVAEAFDKVTSAAEEAQSKLDGFVKDIRDFIREQTLDLVKPSQTTQALFQEFGSTVSKSLQGDENSLSYLPDIASQTIESARNSSASLREFNKLRGGIIGSLGEVASKIESGDLKILTPQEQSNVLLEQIVDNTGTLAQDLAKEIDRQAAIREIVFNPEAAADALALTVAQALQESSYEFSLDPKTVAFLEEERLQQDKADAMGRPELGPLSIRMGAVDQLMGAFTPGASAARIGDAIKTGDISKLATDLSKVTLSNLGIKAPSLDEFIFSVDQAAKNVSLAGTYVAAQAANAIQAAKNTVNSLIDALSGDSSMGSPSYTEAQERSGTISGDWDGPRLALGGAFNKGIKMFETGGAFTNSVVSNPTLFPLGVMGEAGPEAIMPLTRTSDGSLGVEATVPLNATMNRFNAALLQEVKELRKEIEKVRVATEVSATGTNKTYRLLDRVTENGDAFNVVVVTA